jgi:hypothetical protein
MHIEKIVIENNEHHEGITVKAFPKDVSCGTFNVVHETWCSWLSKTMVAWVCARANLLRIEGRTRTMMYGKSKVYYNLNEDMLMIFTCNTWY